MTEEDYKQLLRHNFANQVDEVYRCVEKTLLTMITWSDGYMPINPLDESRFNESIKVAIAASQRLQENYPFIRFGVDADYSTATGRLYYHYATH